jgi:hypothetical protein
MPQRQPDRGYGIVGQHLNQLQYGTDRGGQAT